MASRSASPPSDPTAAALALARLRQVYPDQTELELVERVLGTSLVPRAPHAPRM